MRQIDRLAYKGKLALAEFASLERILDQGQQVLSSRPHLAVVLLHQSLVAAIALA